MTTLEECEGEGEVGDEDEAGRRSPLPVGRGGLEGEEREMSCWGMDGGWVCMECGGRRG